MAEPEEVIIDAARHAASTIGRLRQRRSRHDSRHVALADYKERLELLIAAVYGVPLGIRAAQPPAPPSALSRLFGRRPRHLVETRALAANDGSQIFLPREFLREHGDPLPLMRTLALQQAGRCLRAAGSSLSPPADVLVRDLFQLSEAAAVDHALAQDLPGITAELITVRHAASRERPQLKRLGVSERAVEELYRHVLESHPAHLPAPLVLGSTPGDSGWAEAVLSKRSALLAQVKRRFEGLRPIRVVRNRQPEGADVDISAYVSAFAEERAGRPLEDRLYLAIRPARRDIAIALLIDISGSTDAWVAHDLRIIDVEKEALVIVCHALDALGDPYTIQAFSGEAPANVALWPVKDFDERASTAVYARIAALEPERYTRAGAAIRHTATLLSRRGSQHRLLILLSDGKPNDIDHYEGRYGVEDMRQAVAEATLQGIHPFCLTVDRHAPRYLPGVFGPGRYAVLQHPEQLPVVLVDILRRLVRS
jgi:hypothetical protein